jgi:O-antigen biosynthesis protein
MDKFNPLDHPVSFMQPLRIAPTTWAGHIPFAFFLVDILRPRTIVELGAQYGVSYCAFCQVVHSLKLDTRCFAIDTWRGDGQAGYYAEDVLADLKKHHDLLYSGFSQLIQSTFDNALDRFPIGTIDLLHIDGYHTYEAVKNDFDRWLPRMSEQGVILFHDVAVKRDGFGVWRFWSEICSQYPGFEFSHGYGLGILAVGDKVPAALDRFIKKAEDLSLIQEFFLHMGLKMEKEFLLAEQIAEKDRLLSEIHNSRAWKIVKSLRQLRTSLRL